MFYLHKWGTFTGEDDILIAAAAAVRMIEMHAGFVLG